MRASGLTIPRFAREVWLIDYRAIRRPDALARQREPAGTLLFHTHDPQWLAIAACRASILLGSLTCEAPSGVNGPLARRELASAA